MRAARLGVEPDVELRRRRDVAEAVAAAHHRHAPEARQQLGPQRRQQRDVRERPDRREQDGLVAALEDLGQQVDRVHRHDGRARLGHRRAAEPVGAVHDGRVAIASHHERPRGTGRDGHVLAPGERQHAQRVARRRLERQVAGDRREREQLDLRAREREQDRDRVVDAGVAVDDERAVRASSGWRLPRVRNAGRGRAARAADHADQGDQREDVRQR